MDFVLSPSDQLEYKLKTLEFKIAYLQSISDETFIVGTSNGKVRGAQRRALYGENYYSFERIPYAQPPVGDLRFRAPHKAAQWKNVLDCTQYGQKACQSNMGDGSFGGSEDCLYLNIYTPDLKPGRSLPVMVWIHGGAFLFGEATPEWYGPDYFMRKEIVLITLQYRLGCLGFLSLSDPHLQVPGNAGLQDIIMALRWVKRNCFNFGGNPDCVTLFGESAGGMAIAALMSVDQCESLFHRAILQSGTAIPDWPASIPLQKVYELAQEAGYNGRPDDQRAILQFLKSCTAELLVDAEAKLRVKHPFFFFEPCLEPYKTLHSTLVKKPLDELRQSWSSSIPVMIGATSNEGIFWYSATQKQPETVKMAMDNCLLFMPNFDPNNTSSAEVKEKTLQLRQLHFPNDEATPSNYFDLIAYSFFWHPIDCTLQERQQTAHKAATYLYRFDFDSDKLMHPFRLLRWGRGVSGVAHTDDLIYLFSSSMATPMDRQSAEFRTIERMVTLWVTFAEFGSPNGGGKRNVMGIDWQPISKSDSTWRCLNIGEELKITELPEMRKILAWRKLQSNESTKSSISKNPVSLQHYVNSSL